MGQLSKIFDSGRPLIVRIEPDANGVWNIVPSSRDAVNGGPYNGRIHRDLVDQRRQEIEASKLLPDWSARRLSGAPPQPRYKTEQHVPIILIEDEHVQFRCEHPFVIWVDREPSVSIAQGSPQNPFKMKLPVVANGGATQVMEVEGTQQRFYKCSAWVDVGGGQTVVVDPDCIIDF